MLQRLNYNFAISAILPFCKLSPIHATRPAELVNTYEQAISIDKIFSNTLFKMQVRNYTKSVVDYSSKAVNLRQSPPNDYDLNAAINA